MQENTINFKESNNSIESNIMKKSEIMYFTTSTYKLILLSFCSFGFYQLFWFYKNWVIYKERTGNKIMPFWRTFFSPIWAFSLFNDIKNTALDQYMKESISANILATLYLFSNVLWKLPDPFWLVAFSAFLIIIPVNNLAIKINKKVLPEFQNNNKFSGWNWLLLFVGIILIALTIIGVFIPKD